MKTLNIFRLNDFSYRKFFILIFSLILSYDILFVVNYFNLSILDNYPVTYLVSFTGFFLLTFVPGFIILRIFNIHDLDKSINVIFAVALSIFFLMLVGFLSNLVLPFAGVSRPISAVPVFCIYNIVLFMMLIFTSAQTDSHNIPESVDVHLHPLVLLAMQLPFLSIFGSYLINCYGINQANVILFLLISFVPFIALIKKVDEKFYPLIIYLVSFSILYNLDLVSDYVWGYDSFYLLFGANKSISDGIWTFSDPVTLPLLISSVLFPIYSLLCDLEMIWVFKLMSPFFYSFLPVALYNIYRKIGSLNIEYDSSVAFLASLVFMFYYGFSKDFPNKQHIGELFLSLILFSSLVEFNNRKIMVVLLCFSLVTVHYGISYLFIASLFGLLALRFLFKGNRFTSPDSIYSDHFILYFFVLSISWYLLFAEGAIFDNLITIFHSLYMSIFDSFHSDSRSGISYALYSSSSILWLLYKGMHILLQIFIFAGMFKLLISFVKGKINPSEKDFFVICSVFYMYLLVQTVKSSGMGFDRVLQISLIFMSPIALVGFESILEFLLQSGSKLLRRGAISPAACFRIIRKSSIFLFSVFLVYFFFFNSGFIFEIANDDVPSCAVSLGKDPNWNVFYESEVSNLEWLENHGTNKIGIDNGWYTTIKSRDGVFLRGNYAPDELLLLHSRTREVDDAYIFMGSISRDTMSQDGEDVDTEETDLYKYVLSSSDKIYENGNSLVYYSK